jgi:hypothetical protein
MKPGKAGCARLPRLTYGVGGGGLGQGPWAASPKSVILLLQGDER